MKKSWKGNSINLSINQEAREIIDDIAPHLEDEYDGPAHFFREKLREEKEQSATIEDKIEEFEKKKRIADERIEELRRIKEEKENKKKLRDLKNTLEAKQSRFEKLEGSELLSVEAKREKLENKLDPEEFGDLIEDKIEEHKQKLEERKDLDQLRSEILDLQKKISELEDDSENQDWFLEVEAK